MPKKTRKEKIIAQQRRSTSVVASRQTEIIDPIKNSGLYTFQSPADKKIQKLTEENAVELKAIKTDLYKTILLATVAFSVELYLYWLLK